MYQNMKKINIKGLLWKFRGKDTKFEEEKKKRIVGAKVDAYQWQASFRNGRDAKKNKMLFGC
jgi:hypothetical protein